MQWLGIADPSYEIVFLDKDKRLEGFSNFVDPQLVQV